MHKVSAKTIRSDFLKYFEQQGHRVCSSYPLVPPNDPTLLFTNAGMVQFKDVFTGKEKRDFRRAASSQKCVRAGGKHNDLENVGYTARHHTFFEMLGNFSLGDYFKRDAIRFAWEFLVDRMKLPLDRLSVTVFAGDPKEGLPADDEAAELWQSEVCVARDRILRFGKKDNFWSMGETGPCGPCSEIHFNQGDAVECHHPGGCLGVGCDCDRHLEVWNLVFMQFNRHSDGRLEPLPAPSIDTGMGLERLTAILQGVPSNYQTDLFTPLTGCMGEIAKIPYGASPESDVSLRVVADHARATAFLMADGVLPSNEGRGYVLRRIMRRAIRHGSKLGVAHLFFHQVCQEVIRQMGADYPELVAQEQLIKKAVRLEEETFRRTLDSGLKLLTKEIAARKAVNANILPGKLVFDLQTRDGFPPDLTAVIAREQGFSIHEEEYQKAWEHHQAVSGQGLGLEGVDEMYKSLLAEAIPTEFVGYHSLSAEATVTAIISVTEEPNTSPASHCGRRRLTRVGAGETVEVVVSRTPCYGESGGQVGDTGRITFPNGQGVIENTKRPLPDIIVHKILIEQGELALGQSVEIHVDPNRRAAIRRNHSATHLLQAALRKVLGLHVHQKGSLVAADHLRFDFSHFSSLTSDELVAVEKEVNRHIRDNHLIETREMDLQGARDAGATMLFGEKYGERVRMIRMGAQSLELCGGTHAERTGDIGVFRILSEASVQSGVRRIEALTGEDALHQIQAGDAMLQQAAKLLKTPPAGLAERLGALLERERKLQREVESLKQQAALSAATSPASMPAKSATAECQPASTAGARTIAGVQVWATRTEGIELGGLRGFADQLRDRIGGGVVLAATVEAGKVSMVCTVSKELSQRLKAGTLLSETLKVTGGRGGGRPDFAQGGGGDPALLDQAFSAFYQLVEQALSGSS